MATVLYEYFRIQNKYFQIPVTPTLNTRVECDNCGMVTNNGDEFPGIFTIGNEWDNSTISICWNWTLSNFYVLRRFGNFYRDNDRSIQITSGQRYNMSIDRTKLTIGSNEYQNTATAITANNKPLTIGARNDNNSGSSNVIRKMDGWVGDFRIYDNDVLVMELKPAIKDGDYCYYDTVGGGYYYAQGNGTIEAINQLHVFTSDKQSLRFEASGGTGTIEITAETGWTCTTPTAFTFSTTSGVSGTTSITVTAPANTGSTKIEETITFTDDDNYTFNVKLRQKVEGVGYSYLQIGEDTIDTFYIGDVQVEALYMGDEQIFSV